MRRRGDDCARLPRNVVWGLARQLDFPAMGVFPYHNFRSVSEQEALQEPMGLADDLLEDARHLAAKGDAENRDSCRRRAISTAYYAVFHFPWTIS